MPLPGRQAMLVLVTRAHSEYDAFSEIYAVWTDTSPAAQANRDFYVETYLRTEGPVVELGVGDGRIAVEAAIRGRDMIGVDLSGPMLELCRQRAESAGVSARVSLQQADFRTFVLDTPASLISLPYHSIGHLRSLADKQAAVAHVFHQLRPGGVFIFDDFVMTPDVAAHMRRVQLRAEYTAPDGADALLWVTSLVDDGAQSIRVVTWEDRLDADGVLARREYRRLSLSWLEPAQSRALLAGAGFVVDACYGSFAGEPFAEGTAREQIWIAHRPA